MIVASRELTLHVSTGPQPVLVTVFAPEPDGKSWICRYEINWPAEKWTSFASGFDSAQALIIAFQKIGADVYFSDYHKSGALAWDRPGRGYGFPLLSAVRDVAVGDDVDYC